MNEIVFKEFKKKLAQFKNSLYLCSNKGEERTSTTEVTLQSNANNKRKTRAMTQKWDYTGIEFPKMFIDLVDLKHKLDYELDTDGLINELQEVDDLTTEPTREIVEELTEHIETYQQMASICEELRRRINGYLG